MQGLSDIQKIELKKRNQNLAYNLFFYEDLHFLLDIEDSLMQKLVDLEQGYDLLTHLRYSLLTVKKFVLLESISNFDEYLVYLNINNKKGHRDVLFDDVKTVILSKNEHIQQVDTKGFFDYRNSKKVKMEIENYLKTALKGIQEPHEAVVRSIDQRDSAKNPQRAGLHHFTYVRGNKQDDYQAVLFCYAQVFQNFLQPDSHQQAPSEAGERL